MISDVHANLPALEAVLASIDAVGPDEIWCLGDLVGYGAQPDECTALVRERCARTLVGNHDLAVVGAIEPASFSETARAAVEWTRERAGEETVAYLATLGPASERERVGLFHASPRDPIWEYVLSLDQAEAGLDAQPERVCLVGHSHVALFFSRPPSTGRRSFATGSQAGDGDRLQLGEGEWLLNPGSVGQPRDGDPRAAWLELDTEDWTARYHRVPYDVVAAGTSILAAGLPTPLAERLQVGR